MTPEEFERLIAEEFESAIPERFKTYIKNVALLVEDEPSREVRAREGLTVGETLLGYYHGIPVSARGDWYGMGASLPDSITLFRIPILEEAAEVAQVRGIDLDRAARKVIRDTIWHEVAHHFGMNEAEVRRREDERKRES